MSREEKKLSGAMRLFEALSGVEEELLAKADGEMMEVPVREKKKKLVFFRSKSRLAASLAAAASILLVVCAVWAGMPMLNAIETADTAVETAVEKMTSTTTSGTANDTEVLVDEAFEEVSVENEAIEKEAVEEAEDIEGSVAGDKTMNKSEAKIEGEKESTGAQKEVADYKDGQGRGDGAITELVGSVPLDERIDLSESQARSLEVLGAYIPAKLPAGYTWESAKGAVNAETGACESISLCWTKGMDSIMLRVSLADANHITLTDIAKKETYDVSLYDIPYAETVPEEYRQNFEDPVFAAEDLSLELVQSRMKAVADSGDTDTPRGSFSIWYPEGILVDFNGDGTPEEIWEMFR